MLFTHLLSRNFNLRTFFSQNFNLRTFLSSGKFLRAKICSPESFRIFCLWEKLAKENPNTKKCVGGERAGSFGINEVFFVQETVKIRHQHLQAEETVNAGCSTYYKEH